MSGAAAKPLLAIIILLTGGSLAFGQAGSIGGTIGKTDKSVSGVEEPRAPAKSRRADRSWSEFVFQAYHHHQYDAIFLAGLPDVKGSRPHAH